MVSGNGDHMAIKVYKANVGCTFNAVAIDSVVSWGESRSGSRQAIRSDGAVAANFAYIEGLTCSVSVTAFSTIGAHTMKMASLVLKGFVQDEGLKSGTPTAVTLTATKAILMSVTETAVTDGQTANTYTFELHSTDGTEAGLFTLT